MGASNVKETPVQPAEAGTSLLDLPEDVLKIIFWDAVTQVPANRRFTFASLCNTCRPWRTKIMANIEHWSRERLGSQVQTSLQLMQLPPTLKTLDFTHVKFTPSNAGIFVSLLQKHAATLETLLINCTNIDQSDLIAWIPQLPKLQRLEFTTAHPKKSLCSLVAHIPKIRFAISRYFERLTPEYARFDDMEALSKKTKLTQEQLFIPWSPGFCHGSTIKDTMVVGDMLTSFEKCLPRVLPRAPQLEGFTLRSRNPSKFAAAALDQALQSFKYLISLEVSGLSFNQHKEAMFKSLASTPPLPYLERVILTAYDWVDVLSVFCNPEFFPSMLLIDSAWARNDSMHNQTAKLNQKKIGGGTNTVSVKLTGTVLFDKDDGSHHYYLVDHPGYKNWVILFPNYRFEIYA
eukprot:TRINITY_DN1776_c0_g1_i1.p1 TRINITY_DN1776_c0_g1~~TRINITY_DN1776_c0_g1_i1.p1  ORF type:complete len:404 (-),score=66.78 TRINITY_DN1776_c0_g1_i1:981-2192(-)